MNVRNITRTTNIGPVLDVVVSKDQGLLCIDIEVSSPVHNTAWIRISRGVTQWARQSSEFPPEIEGKDTVSTNGRTAVATAQPENVDLRPNAFILKAHRRHRPTRATVHSRTVVGSIFKLGSNRVRLETCWYDDNTPTHIRAVQGHCSRPIANSLFLNQKHDRDSAWMDDRNQSCKFPAELRQHSV